MANAHRSRHGNIEGCLFCKHNTAEAKSLGIYRNKNGHRHNPTRPRHRRSGKAPIAKRGK